MRKHPDPQILTWPTSWIACCCGEAGMILASEPHAGLYTHTGHIWNLYVMAGERYTHTGHIWNLYVMAGEHYTHTGHIWNLYVMAGERFFFCNAWSGA